MTLNDKFIESMKFANGKWCWMPSNGPQNIVYMKFNKDILWLSNYNSFN